VTAAQGAGSPNWLEIKSSQIFEGVAVPEFTVYRPPAPPPTDADAAIVPTANAPGSLKLSPKDTTDVIPKGLPLVAPPPPPQAATNKAAPAAAAQSFNCFI
jgi:hypothetical protein